MNDSLLTTLCLQYRPEQVAAAVVYLSYLYTGLQRVDTTALDTDEDVVAGALAELLRQGVRGILRRLVGWGGIRGIRFSGKARGKG